MKRLLLFLVRWLYRYEAHRLDALKSPGPVLLIPNHVSWLDWLFLMLVLDDDWKFVTSSTTASLRPCSRDAMTGRPVAAISIELCVNESHPVEGMMPQYALWKMAMTSRRDSSSGQDL